MDKVDDNIYFGIENFCNVKYHGKNEKNVDTWYSNNEEIPVRNGFTFKETILKQIDLLYDKDEYYEIIIDNKKYYYKDVKFKSLSLYRPSLKDKFIHIDKLINERKKFAFLITAASSKIIDNIFLNKKIIDSIKNNLCKIVINTSFEPFSDEIKNIEESFNNFAIKYNLNKTCLKILTGNLIAENSNNKRYEFIPYEYFFENPFFLVKDLIDDSEKENTKNNFININNNIKKFDKKILCYNRRPHLYRKYVFYELYNNVIIKDNSYISLNNKITSFCAGKLNYTNNFNSLDLLKDKSEKISNFYKKNINKKWEFDRFDTDTNLSTNFDSKFHKKTFLSLVTETNVENNIIFFSEKTFKPIYACQPFIIIGNPGSLKKLKEMGFRTFNNWWNEDYDKETDFIKRFDLIKEILIEISLKSDKELIKMLKEMTTILEHNYDLFMNTNYKFFNRSFSKILEGDNIYNGQKKLTLL